MSPFEYIQEAVGICEEYVAKHFSKGYRLLKRAENPFDMGNCPELDCPGP